jgi:hypothetical protein
MTEGGSVLAKSATYECDARPPGQQRYQDRLFNGAASTY